MRLAVVTLETWRGTCAALSFFGIMSPLSKQKKGELTMPRLLERDDVMRTAVSMGRADKVWFEQFRTSSGDMTFKLPEGGIYQVVFVRVDTPQKSEEPTPTSAVDLIGYGRKFNPEYRSTAEIMKELREGEEP